MNTKIFENLLIKMIHAGSVLPLIFRSEMLYNEIKTKELEEKDFNDLLELCRVIEIEGSSGNTGRKYLNVPVYLRENVTRGLMLGIDGSKNLRVLDLGCGPGYFLLVCRYLGHKAMGLDIETNSLYNEFIDHFSIERIGHEILAYQDLPSIPGGLFDLITAFSIGFHQYRSEGSGNQEWGRDEWHYFLNDVHGRLVEGGTFFLRLNISGLRGIKSNRALRSTFLEHSGFETRILNRRDLVFTRKVE